MRLTCPNCDAEYEVPDDVIPTTGRDVQCSNCSNTWFQAHPDHPLDASQAPVEEPSQSRAEDEDTANAPQDDAPIPDAAFAPHAQHGDVSGLTPAATPTPAGAMPKPKPADAGPDDGTGDDLEDDPQDSTPPPPQTTLPELPARREIDPTVVSVLRAEAEREQRARAAAAQRGLETQPELGLTNEASESHRARADRLRPMARAESATAAAPAADDRDEGGDRDQDTGAAPTARRSLYPAIEEINAAPPVQETAPQAAAAAPPPPAKAQRHRAFRSGVLLAVLIAVALLLVYIFAAQLADIVPSLSGPLSEYSTWVDGLRQWLDSQFSALMLWLNGITSPASEGGDSFSG